MTAGALIAGGHARRLGGIAKGLITLPDGTQPFGRAVAALRAVTDSITIIGRADNPYADQGFPVLPDRLEDRGPPGGVHTALWHAQALGAEWAAVLPCDLPGVTATLLAELHPHLGGQGTIWQADGRRQPLVGFWHVSALPTFERLLGAGRPGFRAICAALDVREIPAPDRRPFFNLNTPEDLARIRGG
jgi:molybdopterin-guanine dinucleotide biosynthesis protein A